MPLNLDQLEGYRLQDRLAFRLHCRQEDALVADLRTEGNGLVVHRPNCKFLQKTIVLNDTNLTEWYKFGTSIRDFPDFQALARASGVPLFFTCKSHECRNLQEILGY
jgi:hypothetical protein